MSTCLVPPPHESSAPQPLETSRNGATSAKACKRFCQTFLVCTSILFAGIAAMNFLVNPYAQYAPTWFQPMVQTSRAQKVDLLRRCDPIPEGLILGSSRVLKLEPDFLERQTGYRFFNAGMNYGKPEDFLAFLRYYHDTFERAPKMVVLGLDVNAFTDGSPPDARLLSNTTLAPRVPEAINLSDRLHRWRELLSWQQTKSSLKSLKVHIRSGAIPDPVESFRCDGLIVYHQRERELAEGTYDFNSALDYNKHEYKQLFRAFQRMSDTRCEVFGKIASICRAKQIRLVVYLTPMHPELVTHLSACSNYQQRKQDVLDFLVNQRNEHGFTFWDLSMIGSFDGDATMFVDGIHPLEFNTRLIIQQLLIPQPGAAKYAVQ